VRHVIITDNAYTDDGFVGQNECSCGWSGDRRSITDPQEKRALHAEIRAHRWVHRTATAMFTIMIAVFAVWVTLIGWGVVWLIRGMAGI
jgi:hypothetical protein